MCRFLSLFLAASGLVAGPEVHQQPGVVAGLPTFTEKVLARTDHPLAWRPEAFPDFAAWRATARARVQASLLRRPPAAPWDAVTVAEEDRGTYVARRIVFNLTGDSRVSALMTVPKGPGPFPAVLLLHDHGAKFDIGKEKMIRPVGGSAAQLDSAVAWVEQNYSGRFVGDELARRGYICFSSDALNWSDRGGGGFEGQQQLASNLLHLGFSQAGLMAWEDLRAAEYLAGFPGVDRGRVAALGWSMGGFRAWQVAALSDHIAAAGAVCWMSTAAQLMKPGNNQTKGHSAYNMVHPGLLDALDFPDVASLACPKPLLVFAGRKDHLFPVAGVDAAFARMRGVWEQQGAGDRLVTRLWDTGHTFNAAMQDEIFAWFDRMLSASLSPTVPAGPSARAGLVGIQFGSPEFVRPRGAVALALPEPDASGWPDEGDFSLRLQGRITFPSPGHFEVRVESPHVANVKVEGSTPAAGGRVAIIDVRAGESRALSIDYAQRKAPAALQLRWRLPSGVDAPVPATALSHGPADLAAIEVAGVKPAREFLLTVANPDPKRFATLGVWRSREQLLVAAEVPAVPGLVTDSWCYEGEMDFVDARDAGGGVLELRHRLTATPEVLVVTRVTPAFDAVEFVARLEREDGRDGPWPASPVTPNLCWQLKRSPAFASRPDPYPEFFARCFIFTAQGRVFLDRTERRPIPARPVSDPQNNPPWVQIYGPDSEPARRSAPGQWADYSAERFAVPVVGTVSRDGRHLAAIAMGRAASLCQAWHDCMHINENWAGADGRTWRLKMYAMQNDPAALLAAVRRDFGL